MTGLEEAGDMEKVIRERAYELWEHAGRPINRSFEFWFAARAEFEVEKGAGQAPPGAPIRRRADWHAEASRYGSAADWGKRPRGFEERAASVPRESRRTG